MSQRHIYVVRHGQRLPGNAKDRLGLGITETGKIQAEFTGDRFKKLPINTIHYSTLETGIRDSKDHRPEVIPNVRMQGSQLIVGMHPLFTR